MTSLIQLLQNADIQPVLVDVGASGAPPPLWQVLAAASIYVGFDPDQRDFHELPDSPFCRAIIVNKAITAQPDEQSIRFFLTSSPYCSSTLQPDAHSLQAFLFADLFKVESTAEVPATTLDKIVTELELGQIDWLKMDTQGTDLRLFLSLAPAFRGQVLALDVEPGLIDAYKGEDLFVDVHRTITEQGFWLSNLDVQSTVRMQRDMLNKIPGLQNQGDQELFTRGLKLTPGWCEARYLRRLESLMAPTRRDLIVLYTFALVDSQIGYACEIMMMYEKQFGTDANFALMTEHVRAQVTAKINKQRTRALLKSLGRPFLPLLRNILNS